MSKTRDSYNNDFERMLAQQIILGTQTATPDYIKELIAAYEDGRELEASYRMLTREYSKLLSFTSKLCVALMSMLEDSTSKKDVLKYTIKAVEDADYIYCTNIAPLYNELKAMNK
jgi:hypothetical protein